MTATDAPDPALELVGAAMIARLAGLLGAPRLQAHAARRAGELADALVIASSPALARTSLAAEADALDGVRTAGDLARLLAPENDEGEVS